MKVCFFSPYAAIWNHEFPTLGLSESLSLAGHDVEFIRCKGHYYEFCISMSAFGLTPNSTRIEKANICLRCKRSSNFVDQSLGLPTTDIEDLISSNHSEEVSKIIEDIDTENWHYLRIDDLPIGRIAAYEFVIRNKLTSLRIPKSLFPEYLLHLHQCLDTYFAAIEYFARTKVDRVIVYNRLYSVNRIFCMVAEKSGAKSFSIEAGGGLDDLYSRFTMFADDETFFELNTSSEWEVAKKQPLSRNQVKQVGKHFSALYSAKSPWVYSLPKTKTSKHKIRQQIGASEMDKIILLTMSSMDEIFAADLIGVTSKLTLDPGNQGFSSQIDWILHAIEIVTKFPEWHLVIRLHPREMPNKRERATSEHARTVYKTLSEMELPKNVFVNTPEQGISLYDLFPITNLVLNGNSSAGLEASLFDIPVLVHHPNLLFSMPPEFAFLAANKENYELDMQNALDVERHKKSNNLIFRWFNFRYSSISKSFVPKNFKIQIEILNFFRRVYIKTGLSIVVDVGQFTRLILRNNLGSSNRNEIELLESIRPGINLGVRDFKFGEGVELEESKEIARIMSSLKKDWEI